MDGERESVSKMTVSSTARKGLRPDWKTAWAALQMKLVPLIEAKAVVGFFVGGEDDTRQDAAAAACCCRHVPPSSGAGPADSPPPRRPPPPAGVRR